MSGELGLRVVTGLEWLFLCMLENQLKMTEGMSMMVKLDGVDHFLEGD